MATTPLTSQLGLSLASKQTQAMATAATPPAAVAPPTSAPTTGAGTTTNTQTGQVFQNATNWPYTQANATAANNLASNPTYKAPATNNPLGAPIVSPTLTLNQQRLATNQANRKKLWAPTATDNYNSGLNAVADLGNKISEENNKQAIDSQKKFGQDSREKIDYLNTQNGINNQISDLSYQEWHIQAQNNVDKLKQSAAYLAWGIGQASSSVWLAGQSKDITDATTYLDNLWIKHNLQNSYNANSLAYQVKDIKKDIDMNVSQSVQDMLVQVNKLESSWQLDTIEKVMNARKEALGNLQAMKTKIEQEKIPLLRELMNQDIVNHTVDDAFTSKFSTDGTLYNKFWQPLKDANGQPLRVKNWTGKLMSDSPVTLNDGSKAYVYQNPDGSLRTEKIMGTNSVSASPGALNYYIQGLKNWTLKDDDIVHLSPQDQATVRSSVYQPNWVYTGFSDLTGTLVRNNPTNIGQDSNNPWNIMADTDAQKVYAQSLGAVGFYKSSNGRTYGVFPDMNTGNFAMMKDLTKKLSWGSSWVTPTTTLGQFATGWTSWPNAPINQNSVNNYVSLTGFPANTPISQIPMEKLAEAIAKNEGVDPTKSATIAGISGGTTSQTADMTPSYKDYMNNGSLPTGLKAGTPKANEFLAGYTKWRQTTNPIPKDVQARVDNYADDYTKNTNVQSAFKFAPLMRTYANVDVKSLSSSQRQGIISDYAKALDPDSVVREGEYATVAKYSSSWGEKTLSEVKQFLAGDGTLSDDAAKKVVDAITSRGKNYMDQEKAIRDQYTKKINKATGYNDWEAQLVTPEYENAMSQPWSSNVAPTGWANWGTPQYTKESNPLWLNL